MLLRFAHVGKRVDFPLHAFHGEVAQATPHD